MKRGQITLFIILGVIILASFLFLFAISNFIAEQQLEQQRQKIVQHPFDATIVQRFTSVCVDDALKKGIELLGKQGGYIFGSGEQPEFITAGEKVVAGITYRVQSPLYPCLEQFASAAPAFCRYGDYTGITQYGTVQLPPLDGGLYSVEGILGSFIANYVKNCINVDSFAADAGFTGYTVKLEGEPAVSVDFRDTDTYVTVDYPVSVDIGDGELSRYVLFESRVPVRFKQLYTAVLDAAHKEVSNASFSLDDAQQFFTVNSARVQEAVKLRQLSPAVSIRAEQIGRDKLYTIEDPASRIANKRFVLRFAQKNRPPALEFVRKNPSYLYDVQNTAADVYDFLVIKGEQLAFTMKAHEPDGDAITYSTTGEFGTTQGQLVTQSSLLASGIHNQKVTATDGVSEDEQELRVLVDEPLTAEFAVRNYYGQENVVSPEDPFELDSTKTKEQTKDMFARQAFDWTLFGLSHSTDKNCVQFPQFGECGSTIDIESITSSVSGSAVVQLAATRTYAKESAAPNSVERVLQASGTKSVTVVPCIVHDSVDEPYPFNTGDPYLARHTCCEGNPADPSTWKLKSDSAVCYQHDYCKDGYYLATKSFFCSGNRGNMCGNDFSIEPIAPPTCGSSDVQGCLSIPFQCERQLPWSIANGVWCYGTRPGATGCEQACDKGEVVYIGGDSSFQFGNNFQNVPGRTDFKCGCQLGDGDSPCKRTDGSGNGQCGRLLNAGKCG